MPLVPLSVPSAFADVDGDRRLVHAAGAGLGETDDLQRGLVEPEVGVHDIDLGREDAGGGVGVGNRPVRIGQVVGGGGRAALEDIKLPRHPRARGLLGMWVGDRDVGLAVAGDVAEPEDRVAEAAGRGRVGDLGQQRPIGTRENVDDADRVVADPVAVGVGDIPARSGDVGGAVAVPIADADDIAAQPGVNTGPGDREQHARVVAAENLNATLVVARGGPERLADDQVVLAIAIKITRRAGAPAEQGVRVRPDDRMDDGLRSARPDAGGTDIGVRVVVADDRNRVIGRAVGIEIGADGLRQSTRNQPRKAQHRGGAKASQSVHE